MIVSTGVGIHEPPRSWLAPARDRCLDCSKILDPTWAIYRVVGEGYVCLACGRERIERAGLVFVPGARHARR